MGWQGQGIEPNASMAAYGSSNLGVQIQTGSLEELSTDRQFDLVSMIQVIAHFFNIRKALQKAADVTRPGGYWLIETWNKDSWMARAFGQNWHEYSPPSVLHFFSPTTLKQLVSQFGFVEVARGRPQYRISGEHAKSLLAYKLENSAFSWLRSGLKIVPDRLSIPYPSFDLFWMLFQKRTDTDP
jgi:SAM-dependent methyltransferase